MNQQMKILLAYDGSSYADDALKELHRAGLPAEAEAMIFSVAEPVSSLEAMGAGMGGFSAEVAEFDPARRLEQARTLAQQASEEARQHFPGWNVLAETGDGPPAAAVIRKAEEWGASLIVAGSRGLSRLSQLLIGSVSKKIATEADCSVRISRRSGVAPGAPARLVIGVDGSSGSSAAVKAVAARAWPQDSEVRLVTSVEPFHQYGRTPEEKFANAANAQLPEEAKLRAAGLNVSLVVEVEDPQKLLFRVAENWEADCIFVGARKLGSFGRFMLGSVSTAVVAHAPCSVEVVRPVQARR
jgi:nucleotide-binding universal stress UspA family protein